ncbi:DUF742 domain-containing protein [Streptomyces sp. NBC_01304]|uniref:DUF742 domain-containing protein n=1 Tax=Streptomyces sp. NBC_01304 TaxID=2903818 RepID=UPI002E0E86E5|nr:DUF742 domain-containing protein [Streptomyces sp. NBC_01304]
MADGSKLRPYTLTGGRTHADYALQLDTLLAARPSPAEVDLGPEGERIRLLCATPQAVADLAACLGQPIQVAKILASDLLHAQALVIADYDVGLRPDRQLLEDVLAGLRKI